MFVMIAAIRVGLMISRQTGAKALSIRRTDHPSTYRTLIFLP
jgi:uncharacterized protein HemY